MRELGAANAGNTISALLESEHRQVNQGLERFANRLTEGTVDIELFGEAAARLRRHIYLEEEFFFPEIENLGLVDLVEAMMREHGEIWRFLDGIPELAGRMTSTRRGENAGVRRVQNALDALCGLLDEHNFREELTVYPLLDHLPSSPGRAQYMREIQSASPPPGWVCRALRDKTRQQ
ncbi:MAG: hemerythrin domain-containing protein [Chloroflexi bacterium]|nr:hemerythrin domain-containing protein [Chloroflexota bacterium]